MSDRRNTDRREPADRRTARDRRRASEQRFAHIEVTPKALRLLVATGDGTAGKPVVVSREVVWCKGSASIGTPEGAGEFREALKDLVTQERFGGASVCFALGGDLSVTRTTSGPSQRVDRELAELRERSQLYLALGPGPKTISLCRNAIDARNDLGMVSAANKRTVETIVEAAERVGLQVEALESSLVSLARLAGNAFPKSEPILLAQIEAGRIHLGVCHDGHLLLEYRCGPRWTPETLPELLNEQQNRLIRFCGRHQGLQKAQLRDVLIAGEHSAVELATKALAREPKFKAIELPTTAFDNVGTFRDTPRVEEFGAVAGLALRPLRGSAADAPNLLDERLAAARVPLKPILLRSAAPLAAALLVAAGGILFNTLQRGKLTQLEMDVEALAAPVARARELSLTVQRDQVKTRQLKQLALGLVEPQMTKLVRNVSYCLPEDVWLDVLRIEDIKAATIAGASYSESGVYDFVSYLEKAPRVAEIALQGTGVGQSPEGPTTSFDLRMQLATPAAAKSTKANGDPSNG